MAILYQRHFGTNRRPRTDVREYLAWADVAQPATSADWQIHEVKHGTTMGFALYALTSINDEFLLGTTMGRGLPVLVSADAPYSTEDWIVYFVEAPYSGGGGQAAVLGRIIERDGSIYSIASTYGPLDNWGPAGESAVLYR